MPLEGISALLHGFEMITLVEALNYRCLHYVRRPLSRFHVLVGPNASGKTTFLDVLAFLGRFVADGLEEAVRERTANFKDLVWMRKGHRFELAVEARIPDELRQKLNHPKYNTIRYEVAIEEDAESLKFVIRAEKGSLKEDTGSPPRQFSLFPESPEPPSSLVSPKVKGTVKTRSLFSKVEGGNDNYYSEVHERDGRWAPAFRLGPRKSTLGNLPEDETNFPVSTWFKQLLSEGIERVVLNSLKIRMASPPGQGARFQPDGSNLPWTIAELEQKNPEALAEWVRHVQTALPDLQGVRTIVRKDDNHRYLILQYPGGLEVPSWMASDGTLRLLALTLPPYLEGLKRIYLIEEPENGIHPLAVETVCQSLSSVYDSQILLATHSPVILASSQAEDVLCFAKTEGGATDIVLGSEHPRLQDWHGEVSLGALFASGVLGEYGTTK
jgi:predicted ATPase